MSAGTRPRPASLLVLAATGGAVVVALLPQFFLAARSPFAHFALEGLFAGGTLTVAVLALSRYRESDDPHALLTSVGFAVLAINSLLFGVVIPASQVDPWDGSSLPSLASQAGWLVAAACFALARPASRRGPRAKEDVVVLAAIALLGALDIGLLLSRDPLPDLTGVTLVGIDPDPFAPTSPLHWMLAVPVVALLLLAAWDEDRADPGPRNPHPWLSAAYVVASGAQVLFLARPTQYRPIIQVADVFPPLFVALGFVGFVVSGRAAMRTMAEVAHEARQMTGGRAELASAMAHEIKNPLMSIKGLAATGSRLYDSMSDPERLEFFQLIDEESGRLKRIIEDASLAMKVDAGTIRYDLRRESLSQIVETVAWSAPCGEHPLMVEVEPDIHVACDRARIEEVVGNLVENAAKFSPPEESIQVRARRGTGGEAVVEVLDHGPGIPPEQRESVFDKFARYRPPGYEEVPGAGLGLFLSRAHVVAHGGTLVVDGGPGSGTMLRFTIPTEGDGLGRG